MAKSRAGLFIDALTELFGEEDVIHKIDSTRPDLPPVCAFTYRELPEEGMLTTVTYGLSVVNHEDWKLGRPELIVTVDGDDESLGISAAMLAEQFRGECPFCYGNLLNVGEPLGPNTQMSAFFIFAPSFLNQEQSTIQLPDSTIHLAGMYPLYPGEVDLFERIGLEKFWHLKEYDMYNMKRADLSKLY
jgi:hypothetical protein